MDKDVLQFEITMNDLILVQRSKPVDDLLDEEFRLFLRQVAWTSLHTLLVLHLLILTLLPNVLLQCALVTVLHHQVEVVLCSLNIQQ